MVLQRSRIRGSPTKSNVVADGVPARNIKSRGGQSEGEQGDEFANYLEQQKMDNLFAEPKGVVESFLKKPIHEYNMINDSASCIQRAYRAFRSKQLFKHLKIALCKAEQTITTDVLKKICPREVGILDDPTCHYRVRFRFGGPTFPPQICYKIFIKGNTQYFSGAKAILPGTKAAKDAKKVMGVPRYMSLAIRDEQHQDTMHVHNVISRQEYMSYMASLDKKPVYAGGRANGWRWLGDSNNFSDEMRFHLDNSFENVANTFLPSIMDKLNVNSLSHSVRAGTSHCQKRLQVGRDVLQSRAQSRGRSISTAGWAPHGSKTLSRQRVDLMRKSWTAPTQTLTSPSNNSLPWPPGTAAPVFDGAASNAMYNDPAYRQGVHSLSPERPSLPPVVTQANDGQMRVSVPHRIDVEGSQYSQEQQTLIHRELSSLEAEGVRSPAPLWRGKPASSAPNMSMDSFAVGNDDEFEADQLYTWARNLDFDEYNMEWESFKPPVA